MNVSHLFFFESNNRVILINPLNAEMLAVNRIDLSDAISDLKNDIPNESCKKFTSVLTEDDFTSPNIDFGNNIGLLPTLKCNFCCEYCFEKNYGKQEISPEMLPYIKQFINFWNQKMGTHLNHEMVTIMGGEVFRKDFYPLTEKIFNEFEGSDFVITTNGADLLFFQELIKKYRPSMTVSLDGTESMQMARRKTSIPNVYSNIIEGIRFLVSENIPTSISVVFNPEFEVSDYIHFFDLLEKLGWLSKKCLHVTFNYELSTGHLESDLERIYQCILKYEELKKQDVRTNHVTPNLIPGLGLFLNTLLSRRDGKKIDLFYNCAATTMDTPIFGPDGYIYNCNITKSEHTKIGRYYPSFEIYENVICDYQNRMTSANKECTNCRFKIFCKGGCPTTALKEYNSINKGYCGIWKDERILEHLDSFIDFNTLFQKARLYKKGGFRNEII